MVKIVTASEKDIPVIEDILLDTVRWLDSIGKPLWREGQVKWERLSKDFALSDFRIALLDGIPAACAAVVDHDPEFWPDIEKGRSLFIHKLAVKRLAAGKGLSGALIDHAKDMCVDRGIPMLRLDCHALIPKLRAVYERNGFVCVDEKILYEKYHVAFYECEVHDTKHLYHYFENTCLPFRTITALAFEQALAALREWRASNPSSGLTTEEWYLNKRYEMEKTVREKFIAIGGKPVRTAPVYFTLGANKGMLTWYNNPACIKIPVSEFALDTISFTYGDMFPVFNPAMNTGEEWWAQVYSYADIIKLIEKYGYPKDAEYDLKNRIFPKDKPIGRYLKYVEAHVWSDEVLDRYYP